MRWSKSILSGALVLSVLIGGGVVAAAQTAPAAAKAPASGTTVNLNTATAAELQSLPGIGAKTAERIVEYRQKNGPFKKIEDLMNVRGIGEKSFLKLKSLITVSSPKAEPKASTASGN